MTPRDRQALERIEEIGEVAKRLTPETLATMPGVSWRGIKGMREVIAHDYEEVDVEVLAGVFQGPVGSTPTNPLVPQPLGVQLLK